MRKRIAQAVMLFFAVVFLFFIQNEQRNIREVKELVKETIQKEKQFIEEAFSSCILMVSGEALTDETAEKKLRIGEITIFTYASPKDTKAAYERFQVDEYVQFVETDRILSSSAKLEDERISADNRGRVRKIVTWYLYRHIYRKTRNYSGCFRYGIR